MKPSTIDSATKAALLAAAILGIACEPVGGSNPDAGGNPNCPALVTAEISCTSPACSAATGTKTFAQAELKSSVAKDWVVISLATNEVSAAEVNVDYTSEVAGGLSPGRRGRAPSAASYGPDDRARLERIRSEARLRALELRGPAQGPLLGTAVRGVDLLPPGVKKQQTTCTADAPKTCGATSLCVIPEGMTSGTCESVLHLKFKLNEPDVTMVNAPVKKVGDLVAIVVDEADAAAVSDADATELVRRFDKHIGPLDHQLFGEPKQAGKDRDGNGVVIVFVTRRLPAALPGVVGIFFKDDLRGTAEAAHSNAADLLYVAPPGGAITMDSLSGTLAHEYEHLISFYAKVLNQQSDQEETWLDEGLATFAEDISGYGRDAFGNVKLFLDTPGSVSLNGNGIGLSGPDSLERRGYAALLSRYIFEQRGGAEFASDGMSAPTDKGGVAAIKKMVQGAETGLDAVNAVESGRSYAEWLKDLMMAVAIDGTTNADLACLKKYNFAAPETDGFTSFQRGLDLRSTISVPGGTSIALRGPQITSFMTESGVPLPENGGEFRSVSAPSGSVKISLGGPVDAHLSLVAMPKP